MVSLNANYRYTLDEAVSPKQLTFDPGQGTINAIYELTDTSLKILIPGPGQPRPTEFPQENKDLLDGLVLLEFERELPKGGERAGPSGPTP